jgi:abortive infection bacteriophage resistance protein
MKINNGKPLGEVFDTTFSFSKIEAKYHFDKSLRLS